MNDPLTSHWILQIQVNMKYPALVIIFSIFGSAASFPHPSLCGGVRVPTYETYAVHCLQELAKIGGITRQYSNDFCSCRAANRVDDYAKADIMECAEQGYSIAIWSDDNCGGGCHGTLCKCSMMSLNCQGILPPK